MWSAWSWQCGKFCHRPEAVRAKTNNACARQALFCWMVLIDLQRQDVVHDGLDVFNLGGLRGHRHCSEGAGATLLYLGDQFGFQHRLGLYTSRPHPCTPGRPPSFPSSGSSGSCSSSSALERRQPHQHRLCLRKRRQRVPEKSSIWYASLLPFLLPWLTKRFPSHLSDLGSRRLSMRMSLSCNSWIKKMGNAENGSG